MHQTTETISVDQYPSLPDSPSAFHSFLLSYESLPKDEIAFPEGQHEDSETEWKDAGIQDLDGLEAQMLGLKLGLDFQKRFHGKVRSFDSRS